MEGSVIKRYKVEPDIWEDKFELKAHLVVQRLDRASPATVNEVSVEKQKTAATAGATTKALSFRTSHEKPAADIMDLPSTWRLHANTCFASTCPGSVSMFSGASGFGKLVHGSGSCSLSTPRMCLKNWCFWVPTFIPVYSYFKIVQATSGFLQSTLLPPFRHESNSNIFTATGFSECFYLSKWLKKRNFRVCRSETNKHFMAISFVLPVYGEAYVQDLQFEFWSPCQNHFTH